ncbi:hypothetical protein V12B01_13080 [Vibrio splendidus 12B01]|nr:hypothetical protein V12B01_13080 [Vibrio splendidus 12B01]
MEYLSTDNLWSWIFLSKVLQQPLMAKS